MNQKSLNIMERAISYAGRWVWVEIANDSIQLEFKDVQLYTPRLDRKKPHSSTIAIRLFDNAFLTLFHNDEEDIEDILGTFTDFSAHIINKSFKFQDFDFLNEIAIDFKYQTRLLGKEISKVENGDFDFLLCFVAGKIAIATGGNGIQFFNEFDQSLGDSDAKKLSNKWCLYLLDYWNMKGKDDEYEYDPSCEAVKLN